MCLKWLPSASYQRDITAFVSYRGDKTYILGMAIGCMERNEKRNEILNPTAGAIMTYLI